MIMDKKLKAQAVSLNIRTEFVMFFIFGVIGIVSGICFFAVQFYLYGAIFSFSPSSPYDLFSGWAIAGVLCLVTGFILVFKTYPIIIPPKETIFTPAKVCPQCGAIVAEDATVCEKCRQEVVDSNY